MSGNNNRRNWTRSLTAVILLALAAAVVGCLGKQQPKATDRHYLRATAGSVLFDHGVHQASAASCADCHHPLYSSTRIAECGDCHDAEGHSPEDVGHDQLINIHGRDCGTCHEGRTENADVVSCRACHTKTQDGDAVTKKCSECHDDSYSPDMMEHDEYLEVKEHSCLGCHAPRTISEAYHTSCTGCHLQEAPERFTRQDGQVVCGACHLR